MVDQRAQGPVDHHAVCHSQEPPTVGEPITVDCGRDSHTGHATKGSTRSPDDAGRDREQAAVEAILQRARYGSGRTLLVVGDAGICKSALLRARLVGNDDAICGRATPPPVAPLRPLVELALGVVRRAENHDGERLRLHRSAIDVLDGCSAADRTLGAREPALGAAGALGAATTFALSHFIDAGDRARKVPAHPGVSPAVRCEADELLGRMARPSDLELARQWFD
ncbi:MAG: ATP-binding protein [Acidimicrobiales bacterium]